MIQMAFEKRIYSTSNKWTVFVFIFLIISLGLFVSIEQLSEFDTFQIICLLCDCLIHPLQSMNLNSENEREIETAHFFFVCIFRCFCCRCSLFFISFLFLLILFCYYFVLLLVHILRLDFPISMWFQWPFQYFNCNVTSNSTHVWYNTFKNQNKHNKKNVYWNSSINNSNNK